MKTHRNLPFFVPFAGCPHRCLFCSQEKITGKAESEDTERELLAFDAMMQNAGDLSGTDNQIAFFGGSFTNLPRARMVGLLARANVWLERGAAQSIRISTRPDCIDREIVDLLKAYRVTDVELGIQSMDDGVLLASGRGHTSDDTRRAAELLLGADIRLTGQMMLGLPASDRQKELTTAQAICDMGARESRIYPTVVFRATPLYDLTLAGKYTPLDNETAAKRAAECIGIFLSHGVRILKIGLQSSAELTDAPFGPTDGSISELAYGYYYYDRITASVGTQAKDKVLEIFLPQGELSKLTGHGGKIKKELQHKLSPATLNVYTDAALPKYRVKTQIKGNNTHAIDSSGNAGVQIVPRQDKNYI